MARILLAALVVILAACEPEKTPYPVDIPADATATPLPGARPPVRYALDANTAGYVADIGLITASAQVEQLTEPVDPDDLGSRYELVAAYGDWSGWTRSAVAPHVALVLNKKASPLDVAGVNDVVRQSIDPQAVLAELNIPGAVADAVATKPSEALRAEMANIGYPDGVALTLAYAYTPGVEQVASQLRSASFDVEILPMAEADILAAFAETWLHVALVAWTTPEQRAMWTDRSGAEDVLDLYVLPISYRTIPDLTITLSPGGWPIASR